MADDVRQSRNAPPHARPQDGDAAPVEEQPNGHKRQATDAQPQTSNADDAAASKLTALVGASLADGNDSAVTPPNLPERPRLADGIELMGEMKESAFKDPPWLISREGKFLQVTELVHRVAEHSTGDKTIDEIAQAASSGAE